MLNIKKVIFIIILITILIFSVQISYARYIKNECLNVVQEIANPVLEIKEGRKVKIDRENNIGVYEFSVKNFDSEKISEIDLWYTIEIISNIREFIKFELYEGGEQVDLKNLKTEQILIKGNEKMEKKYKLKIIYNIGEVSFNIIDNVQINIYSEQGTINKSI